MGVIYENGEEKRDTINMLFTKADNSSLSLQRFEERTGTRNFETGRV